ncbi:hypothetical protein OKC48_06840 [Methylorubrum extorquens]|uniref:hypothetical protein n=1 Tax=Methylorubrum extorquens TaxID=408 RepID=UPI002238E0A6|nr:hypothetical protein [Methylorubrum extorquens]UYW28231.1 hypothetical protein OKC48_06840 [Methylorubrum extorquens]
MTQTSSSSSTAPTFCPYVPPMAVTPEALAAWEAEAAEWHAGQAARIASGEEPPLHLVPDFVVLLAD